MLIAKQQAALSACAYDVYDGRGELVGGMSWPDFAVATNARLKDLIPDGFTTQIEISYNNQLYEVAFEYLNRSWFNDIRFMLLRQGDVLASADVRVSQKAFKRSTISITEPFTGQLIRKCSLFRIRYELQQDGVTVGSVAEKNGLTVKRVLYVDLPDSLAAPLQLFILFLVMNQAIR